MRAQKALIVCGLAVFALSGLFPPWVHTHYRSRSHESAGYSLIFIPPDSGGVDLDYNRLLVEWACIGAIMGAAWLFGGSRAELPKADKKSENGIGRPPE